MLFFETNKTGRSVFGLKKLLLEKRSFFQSIYLFSFHDHIVIFFEVVRFTFVSVALASFPVPLRRTNRLPAHRQPQIYWFYRRNRQSLDVAAVDCLCRPRHLDRRIPVRSWVPRTMTSRRKGSRSRSRPRNCWHPEDCSGRSGRCYSPARHDGCTQSVRVSRGVGCSLRRIRRRPGCLTAAAAAGDFRRTPPQPGNVSECQWKGDRRHFYCYCCHALDGPH